MANIIGHTTRAPGTILTAAIYNQDHTVHITNANALNDEVILVHSTAIGLVADGAGFPPLPGIIGDTPVPFNCRIVGAYAVADVAGDAVIDLWVDTLANFPPVVGDSITDVTPLTISSSNTASDETLTDWSVDLTEGSVIRWNLVSISTITRLTTWVNVRKQ